MKIIQVLSKIGSMSCTTPKIRLVNLRREVNVSLPCILKYVRSLDKYGLIKSSRDGNNIIIQLTKKGQRFLEHIYEANQLYPIIKGDI